MRPDRTLAVALALAIILALLPAGLPVPATRASTTGYVWAWGYNAYGQLGNGTTTDSSIPLPVVNITDIAAIGAARFHSLAVTSGGKVWTWGLNEWGQLGNGTTTDSSIPVAVGGIDGVVAVDGGQDHSLALRSDGTVWAWGRNFVGQLGNNIGDSPTPTAVVGLSGVTAVAAGYEHSLALRSDGTVWAWGANDSGQLGDGTNANRGTAAPVSNMTGAIGITAGVRHSLAVKSDGTVWAWGANGSGQLGNGTTTDSNTPVKVAGLDGVTAVAAGYYDSLALRSDGTVWAWGLNVYGQLGDGTTTDRSTPVAVSGLAGVIAIAGGEGHSLALRTDGTVWAWGGGGLGQLGNGTTTDSYTPVLILGGAAAIASAGPHGLAILTSPPETVPPTGQVTINGAALTTTSASVSVALTATDNATGIGAYRLSNDGASWSDWVAMGNVLSLDTTVDWTLDPGDGTKTVYAQVRDGAGNVSLPASDAIDLDTTVANDDYLVSVNGGAVYTNSPDVVLTLAAKAGTTEMKLSNDGGFSGAVWEPYSSRRAWTTSSYGTTVATVSVYAKFRDANGAVVLLTIADDIILDPNAPTPGGGTAAPATGSTDAPAAYASTTVALDTRASDDRSGVRAMMVSNSSTFSGAAWQPYATSRLWPISTAATTTVYLRFRDGAGNVSAAVSRVLAAPAVPTVPTQLAPVHGLATTTRQPTFRWRGVSGATSYQLQVSADATFGSVALSATTSVPSFTRSTPFGRSTTLYWRVRVSGGAWSPAWRFSTPQADPPGLIAPAAGSTTALLPPTLDWAAVSGADLYQVQLAVDPYFTAAVRSQTTSATAATFVPLAREARFFWRVRARVDGVWGAWSNGRSFTTPFLSRPTLRRPSAGATVTRPVTLDWFDVNGAATYRVHVCADAACADIVRSFSATGSILRFAATALPDGDYWWRVRAVAESGRSSAWSVLRSFTL